jgi:hypothetical protein
MLTALLLLPVGAILVWLYWYLLPARKWLRTDSLVLLVLLLAAACFVSWVARMDFDAGGPLWPYIVSAGGAYGILTLGLGVALACRWYRVKS